MEATEILRRLSEAGIRLELRGDQLLASPGSRLTDDLRALLRTYKPVLLTFLADANATTTALVETAMRACDHWGDNQAARDQMRQDVENTPVHLRQDLLEHLQATYPKDKR
jgi:LmbE family N-acetylglucosaminyl deacetylase